MKTITAQEIKNEIAQAKEVEVSEVRCSNCANWGWNMGKAMDSCGGSRCKCRKEKTYCYQFCRNFEKNA